uniref:uncharacterized protein isoform X2 n=1 Tax=Myxine glutinosa TaxID=7769 RepID=UPI00358F9B4B
MDRDISGKDLTVDTAGTTCGSTGGNTLDPRGCRAECGSRGGEHEDKDKVPDFIVKVKVESEFVDVFASQVEDHDLKMKVDPELLDCTIKREDHRVKTECFQSDGFETSQEVSSNCHVKAEPPGSPNEETSDAALMREEKQMKCRNTFSCLKCSRFFDTHNSFNQHKAQDLCENVNKLSNCASNSTCKRFAKKHDMKKGNCI